MMTTGTEKFWNGGRFTTTAEYAHIDVRAAKYLMQRMSVTSPAVRILELCANAAWKGREVTAADVEAIMPKRKAPKVTKNPCTRCGGVGTGNWGSVRNGKCFKCGGTGVNPPRD